MKRFILFVTLLLIFTLLCGCTPKMRVSIGDKYECEPDIIIEIPDTYTVVGYGWDGTDLVIRFEESNVAE